ncbi:MAG: amino acid adenylation domain-containing protein, partial [Halanaerobiales bacterium]|nr:amino acid adenylation domain-containing protein [Halanaerobiales bacterium]
QNTLFNTDMFKKQEEYWLSRFSDEIPVLNLPADYSRPAEKSFKGDSLKFELSSDLTMKLKLLTNEQDATLYMTLLSVLNILLAKYTGQEDIIIGTGVANRQHIDLENLIGMFVNTLVLRNMPEGNRTFVEFLAEVKENALNAYDNQDYPFEMLVENLGISTNLERNPLIDVVFVLQNSKSEEQNVGNLKFKPYEYNNKTAQFDITLHAFEVKDQIHFKLEYSTDIFKNDTIERFAKHFVNIIRKVIENPKLRISEIDMITKSEMQQLLFDFNNTKVEYPKDKTVQQLFEEQVEKTPENIAVVFKDQKLTYRELNEKANQLARVLRTKGVGPDQVVGIMLDRSIEMIIGVLAIIKAGGTYLPIDMDYPESRVEFMLSDSKSQLLLTQNESIERAGFTGEIINITDNQHYVGATSNLETLNKFDDLIYIIYTSGSTGKPKGVMIEHLNVNRLISNSNMLIINENDRILQTGSLAFDASTFEIWGSLLNGACLYLINKNDLLSAERFEERLKENQITMIWLTSPLFNQLLEENPGIFAELKTLLVGGDALSAKHINKLRIENEELRIINGYGPTESTTFTTYFRIDQEYTSNIPIGKPVSNTKVYILDKNNQLQPIGVPGELCIAGDGLARGYLNRPELTEEKFVENQFGERMYRTGDLARWIPDGNIEFLGRVDNQVKIRGFRIELGEIENQLLIHDQIREVIVVDKVDSNDNKYLCAYIVSDNELSVVELREYLVKELPDYMIPAYFIYLDKMPLNANGKIDRRALPEVDGNFSIGTEYVVPDTESEIKMAKIWSKILAIEKVGINDNFFELGGHSLKATQLISRIYKEFNVELSLKEVFKNPTLKRMIEIISGTSEVAYDSIPKISEKTFYPVSSAQKRLFALKELEGESITYNMPFIMLIEDDLDKECFENAFKNLIKRHEALRTSFTLVDGDVMQIVHQDVKFNVNYLEATERELQNIVQEFIKPFDLGQAPLFRVGLVNFDNKHLFMLDMHHIISDGVSMDIFFKDFSNFYVGQSLEELRIQYKDFSAWQNELLQSEEVKKQEEYWLNTFADEVPVLNLPTDYSPTSFGGATGVTGHPAEKTFEGSTIDFALSEEVSLKVNELTAQTGSTLYMTLLAAFNVLLAKYSGQVDIVVGSPIAGRRHCDLENVIGMFVNTLVMRNYAEDDKTYLEFLGEVKENALKAYDNQDYQFEMLVEKLQRELISRDLSRNPLFDVMFIVQNAMDQNIQIENLNFKPYPFEYNISKFDLTLNTYEGRDGINFSLEYSTRLFKKETIHKLAKHFVNLINEIVENPELTLAVIELIS